MKTCADCGVEKPRDQFHARRASPDGLTPNCKPCNCARASAWSKSNRTKANAARRRWYWANLDRVRSLQRQKANQRWKNDAKFRAANAAKMAKRYRDNPAYFARYSRRWAERNKPKRVEINRDYRARHPEKYLQIAARSALMRDTGLQGDQVPENLISVKAAHLQLVHFLKQQTTIGGTNGKTERPG